MYKTFTNYCDNTKSDQSIDINYIIGNSLDVGQFGVKSTYIKCDGCNFQSCPLFEKAPKQI